MNVFRQFRAAWLGRLSLWGGVGVAALASGGLAACGEGDPQDEALLWGTAAYVRDPALDVSNVSSPGLRRSHRTGENCVQCHQALGPGLGQFTLSGSIAGPDGEWVVDPVVELWSAPEQDGGELVATVMGDARGNVYSTEPLPLPESSLFVRIWNSDRTLWSEMPFPINDGSCNHCHSGSARARLEQRDSSAFAGSGPAASLDVPDRGLP